MSAGVAKTGGAGATLASERTSRRARVSEAVSRCVAEKTHGDTITRAELEAWLAVTYPSHGTKAEFDRANMLFAALKVDFDAALLEEHRMAVGSERGGRWRIVHPSEQAALATTTARDAFRRGLAKAQAIASNVDVTQLNDADRARLDDTSARLAAIQMFARKNMGRRLGGGEGAK